MFAKQGDNLMPNGCFAQAPVQTLVVFTRGESRERRLVHAMEIDHGKRFFDRCGDVRQSNGLAIGRFFILNSEPGVRINKKPFGHFSGGMPYLPWRPVESDSHYAVGFYGCTYIFNVGHTPNSMKKAAPLSGIPPRASCKLRIT